MIKEIEAVLLAGGIGARMKELTQDCQKCMLLVDGKPILEYVFENVVDAFGSAKVIIATGFKGESIKEYFGSQYRNISIEYVHSPEKLEVRKRLLLVDDLIKGSFLYLPGDAITHPSLLSAVVTDFENDKEALTGSISGAVDHIPALSHALITIDNNHAVEIVFPPTPTWSNNQLREIGIMYLNKGFLYNLRSAPSDELHIVPVINQALKNGEQFAVQKYFDRWYHFASPNDLNTSIKFNRIAV